MAVNLGKLELDLAVLSKTVSSATDRLTLAKIISKIRNGSVTTVGGLDNLPNVSSVEDGSLFFVESEGTVYVAHRSLNAWKTLSSNYFGSIWAWGENVSGKLGDNSSTPRVSPVSVVGGFTDWCQVSISNAGGGGVRTNGTLWSWGSGLTGRLGDNTNVSKSSPVSVVGGFTDWCQVSVGYAHTAAVRTNGTIWAWGSNTCGMLGDNTTAGRFSPVSVVGGFTDWCQVSAGYRHSIALRTNGTIWSWGCNGNGRLGDNTIVSRSSPVSVVGGFTDWCQASAGLEHSVAVRTNGTIWAWGYNGCGRLGDNTTIDKSSPVSVVGGFTDWCQVSAGGAHTAAVRTNGTLWSWGFNGSGRLGDNSLVTKSSPVSVVGGFTDWCQVSAGGVHTAAVRTNGTIWSWGANNIGQLGDNTIANKSSPVSVVGGFNSWSSICASVATTSSSAVVALLRKTF